MEFPFQNSIACTNPGIIKIYCFNLKNKNLPKWTCLILSQNPLKTPWGKKAHVLDKNLWYMPFFPWSLHIYIYRPATLQERQIWMNMKKNLNAGKKIWMISLPPPPPPPFMKSIHQEGRKKSPPSWYRGVNIYPQFKTKKHKAYK